MRPPTSFLAALAALFLLAGCGERGDRALAYGDGLGRDWQPAGPRQLRIAAENFFTRDVVIHADAPGLHYELTVGPIRQRHMIVPAEKYAITAYAAGDTTGNVKLFIDPDGSPTAKALWVKIRP